jgi:hypothetical protein
MADGTEKQAKAPPNCGIDVASLYAGGFAASCSVEDEDGVPTITDLIGEDGSWIGRDEIKKIAREKREAVAARLAAAAAQAQPAPAFEPTAPSFRPHKPGAPKPEEPGIE